MKEGKSISKEVDKNKPLANYDIPAATVLVIDNNGENKGEMKLEDAIRAANSEDLDFDPTITLNILHMSSINVYLDKNNYSKYYVCPSLSVVAGYRFSPNLFMGVGIGLDDPLAYKAFPLFIHLRSELTKRKIAPYLALSVGSAYLDYFPTDIYDDIFIEGAIGIRKHLNKHGSMWYGLSYSYICRVMETDSYSEDITEHSHIVRFKISYSF